MIAKSAVVYPKSRFSPLQKSKQCTPKILSNTGYKKLEKENQKTDIFIEKSWN